MIAKSLDKALCRLLAQVAASRTAVLFDSVKKRGGARLPRVSVAPPAPGAAGGDELEVGLVAALAEILVEGPPSAEHHPIARFAAVTYLPP